MDAAEGPGKREPPHACGGRQEMRKSEGGRNPISHVKLIIFSVPSPVSWAFPIKIIYFWQCPCRRVCCICILLLSYAHQQYKPKLHYPVSMHSVSHLPTICESFNTRELHYHNNLQKFHYIVLP